MGSCDDTALGKAPYVRRRLRAWYRRNARDLPWRRATGNADDHAYRTWLSEIILQQTRIDQGMPYYDRFIEAYPRIEDLAAASEDDILKLWEGLGYYTRARNLHRCAKVVVEAHEGRIPQACEALQRLPGIGRYTACAISSIVFGERVAVVDGNVTRVLSRLFNIESAIEDRATANRLWRLADALVPGRSPGDHNQAMMELGARICLPKAPQCAGCPIRKECDAFEAGVQEQRPVRRPRKRTPHHEVVVAVIKKKGRYLLGKRPAKGLLGGLWEFPGGKVNPGETHHEALEREVREELGIRVKPGKLIATVNHAYSHFRVTLNVYACTHVAGKPQANSHVEVKWVPKSHFPRYAFPKANHRFLDLL